MPDASWSPLISTPPFPEYVSGHSTFSAAGSAVLEALHGSDSFTFSLASDGRFGARRHFTTFSAAAVEAGMSRIYGGIHFSWANHEGQRLGRAVGEFVVRHFLVPLSKVQLSVRREGDKFLVIWRYGAGLQHCRSLGGDPWHDVLMPSGVLPPFADPTGFFRLVPKRGP